MKTIIWADRTRAWSDFAKAGANRVKAWDIYVRTRTKMTHDKALAVYKNAKKAEGQAWTSYRRTLRGDFAKAWDIISKTQDDFTKAWSTMNRAEAQVALDEALAAYAEVEATHGNEASAFYLKYLKKSRGTIRTEDVEGAYSKALDDYARS